MTTISGSKLLAQLKTRYDQTYKVGGKIDNLFRSLSVAINDELKSKFMKTKRLRAVTAENLAKNDPTPENKMNSAQERVKFLRESMVTLSSVHRTSKPRDVAVALRAMASELGGAVHQFSSARAEGIGADQEARFIAEVQDLADRIERLQNSARIRLRQENILFSPDINAIKYSLRDVQSGIESILNPQPIEVPEPSGSVGSGTDIMV